MCTMAENAPARKGGGKRSLRDGGAAAGGDDEREKTYLASTTIANEDELESGSLSHSCECFDVSVGEKKR